MNRLDRVDGERTAGLANCPGCLTVPTSVIGRCVFKAPVLNEFGVQTTVCCIADVFEEDAHQLVTDGFPTVGVHRDGHFKWFQAVKTRGIVGNAFSMELGFEGCGLPGCQQVTDGGPGYFVHGACLSFTPDGDGLTCIGALNGTGCFGRRVSLEIGCRGVPGLILGQPTEGICVARTADGRQQTLTGSHFRITLHFPVNQVFRCGMGDDGILLVYTPDTVPGTLLIKV